jgi:hypothetical protein
MSEILTELFKLFCQENARIIAYKEYDHSLQNPFQLRGS